MNLSARLPALQPMDLGIPGPTGPDMARAFRSIRADPLTFLAEVTEQYGDSVAFPVPGSPALLLNDPADVRRVLQTGARHWSKRTVQYAALARLTGPGLLASAEPDWIEHRRIAAHAFHHQRLAAVSGQVRAAVDDAIDADLAAPGRAPGAAVDLAALTHRIALDVVGRALFSADLSGHAQALLEATSEAAQLVVRLGRSVLPTAEWAPTPTTLRLRAARRRLDAITADLIAQRRARLALTGAARAAAGVVNSTDRAAGADQSSDDDLLGLMLDSGLPDAAIRNELITMVIAGHETVAAALAWTMMLLAENPDVQDRARAEVAAHPGPIGLTGHRGHLDLTRAVVDEGLRLFPPAWVISRRTGAPDVLAGHPVPTGTLVIISPWLLHRRPASWSDPLTFDPNRFLGDPSGRREGYLPFGQGPRLCIGREFALGEMVVILARLLADWRLELPPGWVRPATDTQLAVHPRGGMPLLVRPVAEPLR